MANLDVNASLTARNVEPERPLLWVLREKSRSSGLTRNQLRLRNRAVRANWPTVLIDGVATRSCLRPGFFDGEAHQRRFRHYRRAVAHEVCTRPPNSLDSPRSAPTRSAVFCQSPNDHGRPRGVAPGPKNSPTISRPIARSMGR